MALKSNYFSIQTNDNMRMNWYLSNNYRNYR